MSERTGSERLRAGPRRGAGVGAVLRLAVLRLAVLRLAALLLGVLLLGVSAAPAFAQDAEDPTSSRSEAFEAAEGPNTENIPGGALMVGAYGAAFLLMLGYVASIGFRQARTARELASLRAEVEGGRAGIGLGSRLEDED